MPQKTIAIYTLYTGKRDPKTSTLIYDELKYIIAHQKRPEKLWKRHCLDVEDTPLSLSLQMWIQKSNRLFRNMSINHILTLYAFTTPLFQEIQHFKRFGTLPQKRNNILPIFDFVDDICTCKKQKCLDVLPDFLWIKFKSIKKMPWVLYDLQNKPFENLQKKEAVKSFEKEVKQNKEIKEGLYDKGIIIFKNKMDPRIFFYPQIRDCLPRIKTLDDLIQQFSQISQDEWLYIFRKYIQDVDALFERMIPLQSKMHVYRGVPLPYEKKDLETYTYKSTSLSKEQAAHFGNVRQIVLEKGTCVIPLFLLSRYFVEKEILLSPQKKSIYFTNKYTDGI